MIEKYTNKEMFQSIWNISKENRIALMEFLLWCEETSIYEKLHSGFYNNSDTTWADWHRQSFVGSSSDWILLQNGFDFPQSFLVNPLEPSLRYKNNSLLKKKVKQLAKFILDWKKSSADVEFKLRKKFHEYYPLHTIPESHSSLLGTLPRSYLNLSEAFILASHDISPKTLLEIGPGECINASIYRSLFEGVQAVLVELPSIICLGYVVLNSIFPDIKICLPNKVAKGTLIPEHDVTFILPNQTDVLAVNTFDIAVNNSSFQEMELNVVNNYLKLISGCLREGGGVYFVKSCSIEILSRESDAGLGFILFW